MRADFDRNQPTNWPRYQDLPFAVYPIARLILRADHLLLHPISAAAADLRGVLHRRFGTELRTQAGREAQASKAFRRCPPGRMIGSYLRDRPSFFSLEFEDRNSDLC